MSRVVGRYVLSQCPGAPTLYRHPEELLPHFVRRLATRHILMRDSLGSWKICGPRPRPVESFIDLQDLFTDRPKYHNSQLYRSSRG